MCERTYVFGYFYMSNSKMENVKNILTLTSLGVSGHNNSCCDIHFLIVFHGFQVLIFKNKCQLHFKTTLKNVCNRMKLWMIFWILCTGYMVKYIITLIKSLKRIQHFFIVQK